MRELSWDEELAAVAQRHADQCTVEHDCLECRSVPRFPVGQNIFRARDTRLLRPDWSRALQAGIDDSD